MPAYVGPEYDAFRGDLVAWEEAEVEEGLGEREKEAAEAVVLYGSFLCLGVCEVCSS